MPRLVRHPDKSFPLIIFFVSFARFWVAYLLRKNYEMLPSGNIPFKILCSSSLDYLPVCSTNDTEIKCLIIMSFQFLHFPWTICMFICVFGGRGIFSNTEGRDDFDIFDDLSASPIIDGSYQETLPVPDQPEFLSNDDLFSIDISSSCFDTGGAAQRGKLRIRNSLCPVPDPSKNVPNIFPSTEEPNVLPPTEFDNQGDLTTARSAADFCSSSKYRLEFRLGRVPVPVCGPALPMQQGSQGAGFLGYYLNVEFSRPSMLVFFLRK